MQQILDRLLAQEHFDLVTVEDNAMGVYRFTTRRPMLLTEYEVRRPRPLDWHGWSKGNPGRWAFVENDWQRWSRYQQMVWRRFKRIQVLTPRDADSLRALAPDLTSRVRVNPFGIDLPPEADVQKQVPGSLVFSGNFTHPPNVDAALWLAQEIMPRLRLRCTGVRLTIVGNQPPRVVQALACADIRVVGTVPEIEPYLEQATVIVAPLRTGGGQRMKVLQGMALGKAVVTTSRGAEGLALGGYQPPLVIADDASELAQVIATLLEENLLRSELGRCARAFVSEHFSPAAYARRLEAVYNEVVCAPNV